MSERVIDPETLRRLVGFAQTQAEPVLMRRKGTEQSGGIVVEDLVLECGDSEAIPALLTRPKQARGPMPALLYCHAHGHRPDIGRRELVDGRPALSEPPFGRELADRGFIALCLDMPGFGDRQMVTESARYKRLLWRGGTLMGSMLSDLSRGVDYLLSRADVDGDRIVALGVSMGGTHAYWLTAMDQRVAAAAHLCCFAAMGKLIETGAHDLHSHYLTVPGLLAQADMGDVAGLVAPRPQLICVGLADPLTPRPAFEAAYADVLARYRALGVEDRLTTVVEPPAGREETAAMRRAVLTFLDGLAG